MRDSSAMDAETRKELLFILGDRFENIRDLKKYQWQSAHYAILALGGLLAMAHFSATPGFFFRLMLLAGCVAIAVAWVSVNRAFEHALGRMREGVRSAYSLMSDLVNSTYPETAPDRETIHTTLQRIVWGAAALIAIAILAA